MSLISRFFSADSTKRDVALLTVGTILAQGVNLAAIPLLGRLFSAEDFGILMMYLGLASLLATAATGRYESHILLPKSDREASYLLHLSLFLVLMFGGLTFCVITLVSGSSSDDLFKTKGLQNWLYWLPMSLVLLAFSQTLGAWHSRLRNYKLLAANRFGVALVTTFAGIYLGWLKVAGGLVYAAVIGQIVAVLWLIKRVDLRVGFSRINIIKVANAHRAAPSFLLPTALLDVATQQLPLYLIGILFSLGEAGQYGMAWRVLGLPSALIGAAVGQVFYQRYAAVWPHQEAAKKLLFKTWKYLALIGAFPLLIILLWGEEIFSLVLGRQWLHAGEIASVLAPMLFVMFVSSPTSSMFLVLGLQKYSLFFGLSFLLYRSVSFFIGWHFNSITIGLWCWVVLEMGTIAIYNLIALKKMTKAEVL
jgi:O-antigen/teichoic acid export membrane protein